VVSFIDCVNRGDVDGLHRLMTDDHELRVFNEDPLTGRAANVEAWRGYVESFPGLADAEESRLTLIWLAEVENGALRSWHLIEDTPANRARFHLAAES
jgi:hypothetical protein